MKWSFVIGRVAGIPIKIHATFFILLLFVAIVNAGEGGADVVRALVFILALFGCVVLHELGHSLVAMRYGIRVRDITLLPIGGVASLERMPENPRHEFLVAIAGPAVNVVIAGVLYLLLSSAGALECCAPSWRITWITRGPRSWRPGSGRGWRCCSVLSACWQIPS
jgi:Zn-dependent protease